MIEDLKPLTSLRFVAAMMIVTLHSRLYFPWGKAMPAIPALDHGVSFFFVLSGFILSHVYTSKQLGYWRFLLARFARLWPVHVFALIILVTFVRRDSITFEGPGIFCRPVTLISNLTLTQSLAPFVSFIFSWNSVSWSISTDSSFIWRFRSSSSACVAPGIGSCLAQRCPSRQWPRSVLARLP